MTSPDDFLPDESGLPVEKAPLPAVPCWRCGLDVHPASRSCPHCAAALRPRATDGPPGPVPDRSRPEPASGDARPLFVVLKGFFAILTVSIVQAITLSGMNEKEARAFEHVQLAVFEAIDTLIVLLVWAWCGSARLPRETADRRVFAGVLALPLLAALVGVNVLYHAAIREYMKIDWLQRPEPAGVTPAGVLLECVQPGVVEEFFFRYLLLGVLRRFGGVHGAVLVSAAMFAVCHIHVLLSMPYLFALGVFLGYVRVWSRSLALPVLLHAAHNLAVTWLEEFL